MPTAAGTVPFVTRMTVTLDNRYAGQARRMAGRIGFVLAGGNSAANWLAGYTNIAAAGSISASWNQNIPALEAVIGDNRFTLSVEDVTPAPYNQPPYPPAGDTCSDSCIVTASSP